MVGDPGGTRGTKARLGAAVAARRLPDAAGRQAARRHAPRPAVSSAARITKGDVCQAGRAAPAKCAREWTTPVLHRARPACRLPRLSAGPEGRAAPRRVADLEVIANKAALLAHIARPIQRLDADVIRCLLIQGSPGAGSRANRPDSHGKEDRSR